MLSKDRLYYFGAETRMNSRIAKTNGYVEYKEILSIEFLSNDETTTYLTLDTSNLEVGKVKEDELVNKMKLNKFNFIVTPKEIDSLIENVSTIVSEGINMSF